MKVPYLSFSKSKKSANFPRRLTWHSHTSEHTCLRIYKPVRVRVHVRVHVRVLVSWWVRGFVGSCTCMRMRMCVCARIAWACTDTRGSVYVWFQSRPIDRAANFDGPHTRISLPVNKTNIIALVLKIHPLARTLPSSWKIRSDSLSVLNLKRIRHCHDSDRNITY